ncbi:MAG: hypothetical protein J6P90_04070 [Rikenellaceae bacterium]|nr:hypothetical protein [Rikenellaceae bacterium]MBO7344149.1 hypothetical protein [Alistipes sp.]
MRKIVVLMLLCAAIVGLASCEKGDVVSNSLSGTLWSFDDEVTVFEKNEFTRYIEFVDDKTVKIWDTDGHGPYSGTYIVDGNNITFNNIYDKYWGYYYVKATYTTRSLTVYIKYDGLDNLYSDVYTKE